MCNKFIILLLVSIVYADSFKEGLRLFNEKEYAQAKSFFLQAIKERPDYYPPYYYLGVTCKNLGDVQAAIFALKKAFEIAPQELNIITELSAIYLEKAHYKEALKLGNFALRYHADNYKIYEIIGRSYFGIKDYHKGLNAFQEGISLNPHYPLFYNYVGLIYLALNEYNKANTSFLVAVNLKPDEAIFYKNLALSYEKLKDYKKAKENYENALKYDPNLKSVREALKRIKTLIK